MQLQPDENYPITYGIPDHTDSDTHYIQAVIRNSATDAVIATVNLADQGDGHRFKYNWHVVPDQTGMGFWITIVTSVYTDSGYTSKNTNYGDKYEEHLIQRRQNPVIDIPDVDYKRIEKSVAAQIAAAFGKLPEPLNPDKLPKVDLRPVLDAIFAIHSDVRRIPAQQPEPTDLSPLMGKLEEVHGSVRDAHEAVKALPPTDFSGVEFRLDSIEGAIEAISDIRQDMKELFERMREYYGNDVDSFNKTARQIMKRFDRIPYLTLQANQDDDQE